MTRAFRAGLIEKKIAYHAGDYEMRNALLMKFIVALAILLLSGCVDNSYNYYPDPKSHYANEIRNRVAVRLRDELQLYPCGAGGGCMYNIRELHLGCDYYNEIDIEEARKLLVSAGIIFLQTANKNEKARPYFANYPFGLKNIDLRFFIQNKKGAVLKNSIEKP